MRIFSIGTGYSDSGLGLEIGEFGRQCYCHKNLKYGLENPDYQEPFFSLGFLG